MNRYESYKDSGVEWLGEIPSHWECVPLRSIFKFRNEKNDPIKTDNILSLSIANGVAEYSEENRGGNKRKDDLTSYKLAYPNDIVINSMNVIVGAVGVSKYFGAISPVYYALYLHNLEANLPYYEKVFKNENFQKGLLQFGKGILIKFGENGKMNTIRMKISQDDIKTLYLPMPPHPEQQKIAQYLDDKTAKIDQAIMLEEKQIELIKEHKQILIQNAVTKGLNPHVKFKHSDVEWIGEVPEHWEVKKLKYLASINNGLDYKSVLAEEGYPVFGSGGQFAYATSYLYSGEAVLLGRKGTIDKPLYINDKFWTVDTMFYCICNKFIHTKFVYYCCCSLIPFGYYSTSTALPSMTQSDLLNNKFTIPPISEQHQIANYLDQQTAKIDHAIQLKQQQIDKLKEYKTVLINDVVTGKVKVV